MRKSIFGLGLCVVGVTALVVFEFLVVHRVLTPNLDGTFTEAYGYVSFFRFPIDIACLGVALGGILLKVKEERERVFRKANLKS